MARYRATFDYDRFRVAVHAATCRAATASPWRNAWDLESATLGDACAEIERREVASVQGRLIHVCLSGLPIHICLCTEPLDREERAR